MLDFQSFDFGVRTQLNLNYTLPFCTLRGTAGYDLVFGGKLKIKENNETHVINEINEKSKSTTRWV